MNHEERQQRIALLRPFVTEHKYNRIQQIVQERTRSVVIVLEDICQPHNAAAVCRTAEGLGINDLYVIEDRYTYRPSDTVDKGASKWLDIHKFSSTEQCYAELKKQGYTLIVTSPHAAGSSLDSFLPTGKIALLFGNEQTGASQYALDNADGYIAISMLGFTESFNISVTAGMCLYDIMRKLKANSQNTWRLSGEDQELLALEWLRRAVPGSREIEKKR